jgi:signal transduction histidine kinase
MGAPLAIAGWLCAAAALVAGVGARRSRGAMMERVARACHEVRGPLTAARLGLEPGTSELSPARLRAIDLELGRAALALDDLSDAGRRRRPIRNWDCVDVDALLADAAEASRVTVAPGAHPAREIQLTWSGPAAYVWGDRLRLAQATRNLIANALEHGDGAVEVHGRTLGGRVRIEVIDGGPGLPASVADLARRPRGGRGARGRGLAIASAVAANHGGRLAAAPSDRGARLVLELPAAVDVAPAGPLPGPGVAGA